MTGTATPCPYMGLGLNVTAVSYMIQMFYHTGTSFSRTACVQAPVIATFSRRRPSLAGAVARVHGTRQEGRGDIVKRPAHWQRQARSAEDVVALVTSGARVFVHGAAATPTP